MISEKVDYPLHVGVTSEDLCERNGKVRHRGSAAAMNGIGDTTGVPNRPAVQEVVVGREILKSRTVPKQV